MAEEGADLRILENECKIMKQETKNKQPLLLLRARYTKEYR
jgi:hypothetical protein